MDGVGKLNKQVYNSTKDNLVYILLNKAVPEIKDVIYDDYNRLLVNVVLDAKSKSRPENYLDDFMEAIDNFEYVIEASNGVTLMVPDMENFKFPGRLKVIEQILNGTVGIYLEISEEDYIQLTGKKKVTLDPVDEYLPPSERFYLIKHNDPILKKDTTIARSLVRYPFSNTPPINLFEGVSDYVADNIDKWIGLSIKELGA